MSKSSKSQNKIDLGNEVFYVIIVCLLIYSKGSIMLLESTSYFYGDVQPKFCLMSDQDGVLVGHMSFQERNNYFQPWGSFLESPDNYRTRKAVLVYMQDRGFSSFASNMIKLLVNETKWSGLLARNRTLILYISI